MAPMSIDFPPNSDQADAKDAGLVADDTVLANVQIAGASNVASSM